MLLSYMFNELVLVLALTLVAAFLFHNFPSVKAARTTS